jgi:nicotinamidase-related amidase
MITVDALPYTFRFEPESTAIVSIDMQRDFIEPGGFGATLGNDIRHVAAIVPAVAALLSWGRTLGLTIVHTREAHLPDLSDCPPAKRLRGNPKIRIGDTGPMGRLLVRGEPGCQIIPQVAPLPGELVVDKPGKGAFYATTLGAMLEAHGIRRLIVCGVTTEVCVQTTLREANDRGYECLLVEDAAASYFPAYHIQTIEMLRSQGGIVCWTAPLTSLLQITAELETRT